MNSIYSIQVTYGTNQAERHGSPGEYLSAIDLDVGEHITSVSGTWGEDSFIPGAHIVSTITLTTNFGNTLGPLGTGADWWNVPFSFGGDGNQLLWISGFSGWFVDGIKLHFDCVPNKDIPDLP